MRTFTFNECYELLNVDPKTFRGWLKEANIDPDLQVSRADRRIRYLTQVQLDKMAEDHGRLLRAQTSEESETISPAAFKLLMDRVARAEEEIELHPGKLAALQNELEALVSEQQEELNQYRIEANGKITELTLAYTNQLNELKEQAQALEQKVDQAVAQLGLQLSQIDAEQKADLDKIKSLRAQLGTHIEQFEAHASSQAEDAGKLEVSLITIQTRQRDIAQQLDTLEKDQARDIGDLNRQIEIEIQQRVEAVENVSEDIAEKVTAVTESGKATVVEIQQRIEAQEQRLAELHQSIVAQESVPPKKPAGRPKKVAKAEG